jgi:bilirubin oxidase
MQTSKILTTILFLASAFSALAQNQLLIPVALTGTNFDLTIQNGEVEFVPGVMTSTLGINGNILGPTLILEKGETVEIDIHNTLDEITTIHWHGFHIPAEMDGGPHTPIAPGETWSPTFTILDHAATMWYHPHLMHTTYKHVMMGLAGLVIIKDAEEAALNLPRTYGVDDIPLVFQTKVIDENGQINPDMDVAGLDTLVLTNGTPDAYFDCPAQIVRFRMLNASSERSYSIGLSNNAPFSVIGSDGGLLTSPASLTRLLMSPGERYEILVDLSGMEGETVSIMNHGSDIPFRVYGTESILPMGGGDPIPYYDQNHLNGANFSLLDINVVAPTESPVTEIPATLVASTSWDTSVIDNERSISMGTGSGGPGSITGPFMLNGVEFDMNVINEVIDLDDMEVWTITNQTPIAHPFHIHDIQFNILELNGQAPPPHMGGWKDVVLVSAQMGSAKFVTRFEDFADPVVPYMYHCHILVHEEGGMMGQFVVVDPNGINGVIENEEFSIYPNPASDNIKIELINAGEETISVRDISGRIVMTSNIFGVSTSMDISSFTAGVYFVTVGNTTARFIKE